MFFRTYCLKLKLFDGRFHDQNVTCTKNVCCWIDDCEYLFGRDSDDDVICVYGKMLNCFNEL